MFGIVLLAFLGAPPSAPVEAAPPACVAPEPACEGWRRQHDLLAWIKVENAERDAKAAIVTGDFRLYGIHGVVPVVPGAGIRGVFPNGCGVRMIKGTSDMVEDARSEFDAAEYAERYNRTILAKTDCLSGPVTHMGMRWSSHIGSDQQNLSFGNGAYDLVGFYCEAGRVGLTLDRPVRSLRGHQVEIASGSTVSEAGARFTLMPRALHRPDLITLSAAFSPKDPALAEFSRTGSLRIYGEKFDVASDDEHASVQGFVADCRQRAH